MAWWRHRDRPDWDDYLIEPARRCVVHWYRNIFSHVPSTKVREIGAMLKAIHASEDLAAAREKANRVAGHAASRSERADCVREDCWLIVAPLRSNDETSEQAHTGER